MIPRCVIIGAGGHAQVVIESINSSGCAEPVAAIDANKSRLGTKILGLEILGDDTLLATLFRDGIRHFAMGIGGAANNHPRMRLYYMAIQAGLEPFTIIHSSAIVSAEARLAKGVQVLPGAIINANVEVGENTIVNSRAVVEHDCRIHAHVHIAPAACLCGAVTVEEGAHIGAGSAIRQGASVGAWATVGLGAVVLRDVPENITVVGNPAKLLSKN